MTARRGFMWAGIAAGGILALILGLAIVLAISTFLWALVVFYGSMFLHWALPDTVTSLTFAQSLGIGFVLAIISSIFGSRWQ